MAIQSTKRVAAPSNALMQELPDGESVFLELKSERYFGLDAVGTRFWKALTSAGSIEAAYQNLLEEYEVDPQHLRRDLEDWVEKLVGNGLLELRGE